MLPTSVHRTVINTFKGAKSQNPSVLGCSWNLNPSVIVEYGGTVEPAVFCTSINRRGLGVPTRCAIMQHDSTGQRRVPCGHRCPRHPVLHMLEVAGPSSTQPGRFAMYLACLLRSREAEVLSVFGTHEDVKTAMVRWLQQHPGNSVLRGRRVKLTTRLHLVPRLRINGAIPLLPLYTLMT